VSEVSAHDNDDAAATEAAILLAISEAFAHPPDLTRPITEERAEAILEAVVGNTLRFYAQRVLALFVSSWRAGAPLRVGDYEAVQMAVEHAVRATIDDTGESVRDIVRERAFETSRSIGNDAVTERVPRSRSGVVESGLTTEQDAYDRLRVGMESVGRITTTRTREYAKREFARLRGGVGKVWRTQRDGRVRTSHGDLEGDFRRFDEPFVTIRNAKLQYPGDPDAPLYETINCRCHLSYRMVPA